MISDMIEKGAPYCFYSIAYTDFNDWFVDCMRRCQSLEELAESLNYVLKDKELLKDFIVDNDYFYREGLVIQDLESIPVKTLCFRLLLSLLLYCKEAPVLSEDLEYWKKSIEDWLYNIVID